MRVNETKLKEYIKNKKCPLCGNCEFYISRDLLTLIKIEDNNLMTTSYDRTVPLVEIVCEDCGYTILINSIIADVVD